jgi:hypothetical protein
MLCSGADVLPRGNPLLAPMQPEHLLHPPPAADGMAAALLGLARGLAQQRLLDPDAVPDDLYGDTLELIYRGWVAVNGR